jgi:Stage II sporulation protein
MSLVLPETLRVLLPTGAVKLLDLEAYVRGVVAAALPADAPLEALKAQAVAARTFAASTRRHGERGAEVCTLRHCQVWKETNSAAAARAVQETLGLVAVYDGRLIDAYYFEHCDGSTREATGILIQPPAYLRRVDCPCGSATLKGHGIGMCQRGALVMARFGDRFDVILRHYYTGITVEQGSVVPPAPAPSPEREPGPAVQSTAASPHSTRPARRPRTPQITPEPAEANWSVEAEKSEEPSPVNADTHVAMKESAAKDAAGTDESVEILPTPPPAEEARAIETAKSVQALPAPQPSSDEALSDSATAVESAQVTETVPPAVELTSEARLSLEILQEPDWYPTAEELEADSQVSAELEAEAAEQVPPATTAERRPPAQVFEEPSWYPTAEEIELEGETLAEAEIDEALEAAAEIVLPARARPGTEIIETRELPEMPPWPRAELPPAPDSMPEELTAFFAPPPPESMPEELVAIMPPPMPEPEPERPIQSVAPQTVEVPPPASVEAPPPPAPLSVPSPQVVVDRLPGPRVIAGDLAQPGRIVTIRDAAGNAVITVSGAAPHYGVGGFEAPLAEDGLYAVSFDGQALEIDLKDETVILCYGE